MELRHLRYFVAVAEERHFARAAARLHVSAPTLSQQIRDLERHLRVQVFDRTPRSVELTAAGAVLLVEARAVLARVDALYARLAAQRGDTGRLRLGVVDACGGELIAPLLAAFRTAHPDVELEVAPLLIGQQADALAARRVDAVFAADVMFEADDATADQPLFAEPSVAALPARHRLAEAAEVDAADLADEVFAFMPGINQRMLDHFTLRAVRGERARSAEAGVTSTLDVLSQIALAGSVATMSATAERFFPRPGIAYRPVVGTGATVFGLHHRPDLIEDGAAEALGAMGRAFRDALPDLVHLLPRATLATTGPAAPSA
jgi:DNA-binding transcriptional LysR family regulator